MKYDLDLSSWKTRQLLLLGGSVEFSETWPRWGSMRNGESWARTIPAHLTGGTGSRSWPTPVKSDCQPRRKSENWSGSDLVSVVTEKEEMAGNIQPKAGGKLNPNWVEWLMGWPIGWTDSKPLGTDRSQQWQRLHGKHSNND